MACVSRAPRVVPVPRVAVMASPPSNMLNPDQHQAVHHRSGPLLVLAGAGSGKTRVVTERIARLIHDGVPARVIVAMTFTNKAANEMLERLESIVGTAAKDLTIGTFHAFGLRVLRAEARYVGVPDGRFAIFDQADQSSVVREILREHPRRQRWDVHEILARISSAKNHFVDPSVFEAPFDDPYGDITEWVYPRYTSALRGYHAFDFDDLVCVPVQLFRAHSAVLERWQSKYWHVLVDEYQDTNHAQFQLVALLAKSHGNLCVVGDDDQSIYSWRGAEPRNILEFESQFPGTTVVKLQNSYRSTQAILAVANAVIHGSRGRRHDKTLVAAHAGGERVRAVKAVDGNVEAEYIADEISQHLRAGVAPRDIAVLYRSNSQSEPFETALRQRHIAFRVVGGTQFYERKEVKDLIAMLRVAISPRDELSLRRIINYPARGVGPTSLERLANTALAKDRTLWAVVTDAANVPGLPASAVHGCEELVRIVQQASRSLRAGQSAAMVAQGLVDQAGFLKDIAESSATSEAAERRRRNLTSFISVLERFDASANHAVDDLWSLLQLLTLKPDSEQTVENVVTLSTIHGAKGLEFSVVFIAGLEEGFVPHARSTQDGGQEVASRVEEERRLFYVAITRARQHLYLCRAETRTAQGRTVTRLPSRFFKSIPQALLRSIRVQETAKPTTESMLDGVAALLAALELDKPK